MSTIRTDVAIIGCGASGLAAGYFSAASGARTVLLEKNDKPGRKLYITGKGRCNMTNDATLQEFMKEVPRNPKFLYSALNFFTPQDLMTLIEENGCPVKVERGRRVFPVSDKASDVTKALYTALQRKGAQIRLSTEVLHIEKTDNSDWLLQTAHDAYLAHCLIIATGGLSYPATGSTGDGYRFAEALGIPLTPRYPSLIALTTADPWTGTLQGLSLKNVSLKAALRGKTIYSETGEMLFTHDGISGPLGIELSCHLPCPIPDSLSVSIDLKPGLTDEQLRHRIDREISANGRKQLKSILDTLLPQRLADVVLNVLSLDPTVQVNQLDGASRETLCRLLKHFPVQVSGTHPVAEAVITRGGVNITALNPATMASKAYPNLYFCGEIIDVDAHTGGYNLQIAFSTGALAGYHAAQQTLNRVSITKES